MSTSFERARQRLDKAFGIGIEEAHLILRSRAEAKRIYDCALQALVEQEKELSDWLAFQIKHGRAPDGAPVEMDELYAKGRKVAFEATLRKFAPDERQ